MSDVLIQIVSHYLRRLSQTPEEGGDGPMLRRYARSGDPAAFEWLVRRHGSMVLGVCRRVLGLTPDAEDAFQATFLALVQQAGSIRDRDRVAAWLHRVAYRTARKVRSRVAPRTLEEAPPLLTADDPATRAAWGELCQVLDEELSRLPEPLRAPLVVCYLDGATQDEAARRLGCSLSTLKRRLEQGRGLLRRRLTARGVAPAGLAAAALLPGGLRAAVPGRLAQATAALGDSFGAVAVPTGILALAQRAVESTSGLLLKGLLAMLVVAGGLAAGYMALPGGTKPPRPYQPQSAAINHPAPPPAGEGPSGDGPPPQPDIASVVSHVVEKLRQRPVQRSKGPGQLGVFLIDVTRGEVILIADEPDRGLTYCGSPQWSKDGRRVIFDASPPDMAWQRTRLQMIDVTEQGTTRKDLGPGNCPALSPDGKRIAFLLNPGAVPDAQPGVWVMEADGSQRRRLGGGGIPKWSPDGRQLLIVSFTNPCNLTLLNVDTAEERPIHLPDHKLYSVPSWADEGTIVAVVSSKQGTAITLVDVTNPEEAKVKETLWRRSAALPVDPAYPVYSPGTGTCVFVGREKKGQALYSFRRGEPEPPKRLEPEGYDGKIASLALSPDGQYALFCSDRRSGGSPPAADASKPK